MKSSKAFIVALCATTILTTGAVWAADTATMKEANATPQHTAADKDLAKFSADGANAFEDMALTRRALYEGRTDDAKKFVALADAGFNKAKTDNTVYTKAEADLKAPTPKGGGAKTSASADATPDAPTAMREEAYRMGADRWVNYRHGRHHRRRGQDGGRRGREH